jgi:hypothetical protein
VGDPNGRNETPAGLDRNWDELLQELRITQTGVELLTAFLVSLPLQQRFDRLQSYQHGIYLVCVGLSVAATGFWWRQWPFTGPCSGITSRTSWSRSGTRRLVWGWFSWRWQRRRWWL